MDTLTRIVEGDIWALTERQTGSEAIFMVSERFFQDGRAIARFNEDSGEGRLQSTTTDEGLVVLELQEADGRRLRFEPPLVVAPTVGEEGGRYAQNVLAIDYYGTEERRRGQLTSAITLLGPLMLRVPAGNFEDTVGYRIHLSIRWVDGAEEARSWTEWYAPRVGLVRLQRATPDGQQADYVLVEAKVGGALYPPPPPPAPRPVLPPDEAVPPAP